MKRLWAWIAATAAAVSAFVWLVIAGRQQKKADAYNKKLQKLDEQIQVDGAVYEKEQLKAEAAEARAKAAAADGRRKIDEVRKTSLSMAERLERYRARRLQHADRKRR